jgi:hypothetical protein
VTGSRRVWRAYTEHVAPVHPVDLVVDTAAVAAGSAATEILVAIGA